MPNSEELTRICGLAALFEAVSIDHLIERDQDKISRVADIRTGSYSQRCGESEHDPS